MGSNPRADGSLNLNLSGLPPLNDPRSTSSTKSPFGGPKSSSGGLSALTGARLGAGSPLHDQTSRLFPKRTRELQTPTGISSNIWGPPTSGTSTPLFEIPESPSQDGFPDLVPLTETGINSPARRGRAGTLPSRISPTTGVNGQPASLLTSKTSRPTPTTSPFRPGSTSASEKAFNGASTSTPSSTSALLSRLRAGSMPQRASAFGSGALVGQSPFSTNWNSRARAATLTSISSADDPTSPQQASLGKEDPAVRTLDYLGLVETPARDASRLYDHDDFSQPSGTAALLSNFNNRNSSRFRSFSVNTSSKNTGDGYDANTRTYPVTGSGTMTPSAAAALEAEYEAIQERVRLHNKAVQDFALNASAARPRARTAGLVDTPQRSALRRLAQTGIVDLETSNRDINVMGIDPNSAELSAALYNLSLANQPYGANSADGGQSSFDMPDDAHSPMSRSLWIGSIPNSTTVSTLDTIFANYGPIESTRVLTHKNCGFVNFENTQDAVRARQLLNGKEIFPGAGPVRIGFAKAPSASVTPIPDAQGQSPAPQTSGDESGNPTDMTLAKQPDNQQSANSGSPARLSDLQSEIIQIVADFGAQPADLSAVSAGIANSIAYDQLEREIPPIAEPSTTRIFDAPRLRDIRKRIDNGACGLQEIEQIAIDMLSEIAELSSDYLGNTVVQKLFEFCSESIKEQMLKQIAPHLPEIGVHKNGTWAAQKIIDVCKSEEQIGLIVEHIRPYTIPLFLDQFGNYVLQCCLRFGSSYNNYIFETMLSHLLEIAQGRFGARAMRACLESHHASKDQQRMIAAIITVHSVQLATSANGALLLTWLLDTCTFPKRRTALAPKLVPHLVQLCTHKVAYLTVLKVVNQRNEPDAREIIFKSLFFSSGDSVLEQILSDQTSGVTFIFKVLTSPFLDDSMRPDVIRNVSNVLVRIKAQPAQGYKRLMDEVGLSSRSSQMAQFPGNSQPAIPGQSKQMSAVTSQYNNNFTSPISGQGFDNGMTPVRSSSTDSFGYPTYGMNTFQGQQQYGQMTYQQMTPQSQFQGFAQAPRNGNTFMTNGFAGYNSPPPGVDIYRGIPNQSASPVPFPAQMSPMMSGNGFAQPYQQQGMNGGGMYGYGSNMQQQPLFPYNNQNQAVYAGGRGGGRRVRSGMP